MELLAARFLLGIYKAAEKPADKFLDAAWKPIEEAITPWFREKATGGSAAQLSDRQGAISNDCARIQAPGSFLSRKTSGVGRKRPVNPPEKPLGGIFKMQVLKSFDSELLTDSSVKNPIPAKKITAHKATNTQ
jgi:hypothetical protein